MGEKPSAEQILSVLNETLAISERQAKATLAKLRGDLLTGPAHALEWSADAFEAAANMLVSERVNSLVQATYHDGLESVVAAIRSVARDKVLAMARYPPNSTSMSSNLMYCEILAAWARVLEIVDVA